MINSLKSLRISKLVGNLSKTVFSEGLPDETIPFEDLKRLNFDLDIDPSLWRKYKRSHNFRYSGASTAEHLTMGLMRLLFENKNSPDINYSTLREVLSEKDSTRIAVLNAHEGNVKGNWIYSFKGSQAPVQKWIDEISSRNLKSRKKYGALFVCCCNGDSLIPDYTEIPIFYLKGIFESGGKYQKVLVFYRTLKGAVCLDFRMSKDSSTH
ncbi:MAG TPA: hypothetical protein ENG87_05290 [Candidatus Pacearchaeota archaeon]|nr:hypothetical protein [Candidatus Pacearchaeota archaeon]HDZ61054.1 hypothetical protein [Candidatus Pacearchaeota archaeon]